MLDRYPGKFLGLVTANDDPKHLGRLQARVPEILGSESTCWCLPSSPFAGEGVGFSAIPPIGSTVFVEWPGGDVQRTPIWSGGMWPTGKGIQGAGPGSILLVTPGGHRLEFRDVEDEEAVELTARSGARILLDAQGMTLEFGSQRIEMRRSSVSINGGALEVS